MISLGPHARVEKCLGSSAKHGQHHPGCAEGGSMQCVIDTHASVHMHRL